ncbi:MAG: SCP2 sterol-binding domain-containing protein [Acidimicrobiales bacterium]
MRFLSAEWLEHMSAATATASPAIDFSVHQRVTGGPDGDVEYTLRTAAGQVRFEPGPAKAPADVELRADYDTAAAISQGRISPASAFAAGRLRVSGEISTLVRHQEAFAEIGKLLAGMAATTTY